MAGQKFTFDVNDTSEPPQRGELSSFQPPEMDKLYGEAYLAYLNYRARVDAALSGSEGLMQVPTTVLVTGWEEA